MSDRAAADLLFTFDLPAAPPVHGRSMDDGVHARPVPVRRPSPDLGGGCACMGDADALHRRRRRDWRWPAPARIGNIVATSARSFRPTPRTWCSSSRSRRSSPPPCRTGAGGEGSCPSPGPRRSLAFRGAALIASDGHRQRQLGWEMRWPSPPPSVRPPSFTIIRATGRRWPPASPLGSLSSAADRAHLLRGRAGDPSRRPAPSACPAWVWLALNGLVAIPLATVLLARGPRVLPSADVSMFFMLETVLTPIWIWMLFGEVPAPQGSARRLLS